MPEFLPFTSYEIVRDNWPANTACPCCQKPRRSNTFIYWIPWLRGYVCRDCAAELAGKYDEEMAAAGLSAVEGRRTLELVGSVHPEQVEGYGQKAAAIIDNMSPTLVTAVATPLTGCGRHMVQAAIDAEEKAVKDEILQRSRQRSAVIGGQVAQQRGLWG
jgi:hypothetical protein